MLAVEGKETAVEPPTFPFEHADRHINACLSQLLHASSLHFRIGIDTAHHHTTHLFADNQIGTRWRFSMMRTRFQTHIERGGRQQMVIIRLHRRKGIHLGVCLTATDMVTLADDAPISNDDRPHHRIRAGTIPSANGKLQATPHVLFIH